MRPFFASVIMVAVSCVVVHADPVQLDCAPIFNARPVSVVVDGRFVPWTLGIDGGGKADGFAIVAAARARGDAIDHALPDDGKFPENRDHPLVELPYAGAGASQPQARTMPGADAWELPLPERHYSQLYLFFTSAEGASQLSLVLHYNDGTSEARTIEMPDYYRAPGASDKNLFALAADLAKWNAAGKLAEADHHYIYGWKLAVDRARALKSIALRKGAAGYVVFWGATGVD